MESGTGSELEWSPSLPAGVDFRQGSHGRATTQAALF